MVGRSRRPSTRSEARPIPRSVRASLGDEAASELTSRLRAAARGRFHIVGTPSVIALGEVLVHQADMLRPLDASEDVDPSVVAPVLEVYRRIGRFRVHAPAAEGDVGRDRC